MEGVSVMRKVLIALVVFNILIAAVIYLPKFFTSRQKTQDFPKSAARGSSVAKPSGLRDHDIAADIQQTVFKKNLPQKDFETLLAILNTNRVTNDLSRHLARSAATETLLTAAATRHLTDAQKPQAVQAATQELAFLKTLSDNSAALSTIPVEARRSGFSRDIYRCIVVVCFAAPEEQAIPIILPYANSPDPKTKEIVGNILKRAHYGTK